MKGSQRPRRLAVSGVGPWRGVSGHDCGNASNAGNRPNAGIHYFLQMTAIEVSDVPEGGDHPKRLRPLQSCSMPRRAKEQEHNHQRHHGQHRKS